MKESFDNVSPAHGMPSGASGTLSDRCKVPGASASYYDLPLGGKQLQDLISYKDMNAQIALILCACYDLSFTSNIDAKKAILKDMINNAELCKSNL